MIANIYGSMKRMKSLFLPLCLAMPLMTMADERPAQMPHIHHTDSTIVVKAARGGHTVCLQAMTESIIRVTITPDNEFPKDSSLIILPRTWEKPVYKASQDLRAATLKTSRVTAQVDLTDGRITFLRPDGTPLLAEHRPTRSFTPIEVEGKQAYTTCYSFSGPAEEALYGLGQHQADEFNYKGKSEELFQYNTKVSVPFIVSTHGYGILWDSYSLGRVGDPRDYAQLHRAFTLYNNKGEMGSLTGTYRHKQLKEPFVRREDSLYFENLKTIRNLPKNVPLYGSEVTYEGWLEPHATGIHDFLLYYAGYVSVYADGHLIVPERWRTAWNPNAHKFSLPMSEGKRVKLRIEWRPDGGESYCGLRVLTPRTDDERQRLTIWNEMESQIDYYFIAGETMDEVIGGYRTLTGKAPVMPRWAMGYWQSRERYKTQKELTATLDEFRQRRLPIDNIVQDWSYWPEDAWGSHEFDLKRFPDPKGMVDEVHRQNAHLMISVWPKFYASTEHYKEFDRQGWMYQQAVKDSIRDWIGPGYIGSFYDAYSYGARRLFWKQLRDHLYPLGIDAWWMDASEPNVRDCTDMEYRKALCGPTALGPSAEYFNAYALMNAHAIYTGLREEDADRRVFQLTRSGFAGLQRYSTATWSGDIASRWEDLKAQIPAGINFSLSGVPFWTMDIGGFCVENRYVNAYKDFLKTGKESRTLDEWRELNTRWFQFGAFCPLFRSHGQYPYREPWHIAPQGHEAYESMDYYLDLRYRLMPYLYSLAGAAHHTDYTLMRALAMDFTHDKNTYHVGDQYMFGPALMVAPVYEYKARTRNVYLPEGRIWYDFYTGTPHQGGQTLKADAPYGRIPLYVPAGSILVTGRPMQYADELPTDTLTIHIYQGTDGAFTLYEDNGTTYAYERGEYLQIPLTYNEKKHTLTVGAQQGTYPEAVKERTLHIITTSAGNHQREVKTVKYKGKAVKVKLL